MGNILYEVIFLKNKVLKALSYVLVAAAASLLTLVLSTDAIRPTKLQQLENYLLTYFVDGVDKTELEDAAAEGMMDALGDRWSYYIPADEYAAYEENKNNAYVGIGVTIQVEDYGYLVTQVTEGGPSEEAGILPGDQLIEADGQSLAGLSSSEGKALIQGAAGTKVALTVLREGETLHFRVERRTVKVKVATGTLLEDGIGVVKIRNFNTNCYSETKAVIEDLLSQGATALIFDVRYNGGGYANEMTKLLDYLLPEGDLFRTVDYAGRESVDKSDARCLDVPMAVLVNGSSYSAAEFFAAALKDYDAAILVGEKTSGKGHYQNTFQLTDGSAVAISTGKYFTPKGVCLEGIGLTPEVYVEVDAATASQIYAGTLDYSQDPQVIAAINALKSAKL